MKGFARRMMMRCAVVVVAMIQIAATSAAPGGQLLEGVQIPANVSVPPGNRLHVAYSAEGHQHYGFNGSAWVLVNATAKLYADAAHSVLVGHHLFLLPGAQPTWHALGSQVTAKALVAVTVDPHSITWNHRCFPCSNVSIVRECECTNGTYGSYYASWNLLHAVSHSGDTEPLGTVTYVQRVKTRRGLPPSTKDVKEGDTHASKYYCVYAFYVKS